MRLLYKIRRDKNGPFYEQCLHESPTRMIALLDSKEANSDHVNYDDRESVVVDGTRFDDIELPIRAGTDRIFKVLTDQGGKSD